jgi:hypothetical protein
MSGLDEDALVVSGANLYVGGFFSRPKRKSIDGFAALDTRTGSLALRPRRFGGEVDAMTIADRTLYVGGDDREAPAVPGEGRVAAYNSQTGARLAWRVSPNDAVLVLAASGSDVYLGVCSAASAVSNATALQPWTSPRVSRRPGIPLSTLQTRSVAL